MQRDLRFSILGLTGVVVFGAARSHPRCDWHNDKHYDVNLVLQDNIIS